MSDMPEIKAEINETQEDRRKRAGVSFWARLGKLIKRPFGGGQALEGGLGAAEGGVGVAGYKLFGPGSDAGDGKGSLFAPRPKAGGDAGASGASGPSSLDLLTEGIAKDKVPDAQESSASVSADADKGMTADK